MPQIHVVILFKKTTTNRECFYPLLLFSSTMGKIQICQHSFLYPPTCYLTTHIRRTQISFSLIFLCEWENSNF